MVRLWSRRSSHPRACRAVPRRAPSQLGGTVGDIESAPFVEAMRQFQFRVGNDNFCLVRRRAPLMRPNGPRTHTPAHALVHSCASCHTRSRSCSLVRIAGAQLHVSLVPVVGSVGEQKTKPTQASVRDLRGLGLSPDVVRPIVLFLSPCGISTS